MQPYGIKIRFQSGCSAGAARCVRDAEVEGSNPFTPTNFFTEIVVTDTIRGYGLPESGGDYAPTTANKIGMAPQLRGIFVPII